MAALPTRADAWLLLALFTVVAAAIWNPSRALAADERPAEPAILATHKRVALVIGNGSYVGAPLENPKIDAGLVKAALKTMNFDVTLVENADLETFDEALKTFREQAKAADVALFYFAGHGFALNDGLRPRSYLMSTDAKIASKSDAVIKSGGLPLDEIIGDLAGQAKVSLFFVDACRNDPRVRSGAGAGRGLARIDLVDTGGVFVGLSTRLGDVAADGDAGHGSPFARAFAAKMPIPGLRLDDAFAQVRQQVETETNRHQRPEPAQNDLDAPLVLVEAPSAPTTALPAPAPDLREAAEIWPAIRDSKDLADLKAFQERYKGTFFASLAARRLQELSKASDEAEDKPGNGKRLFGLVVGIEKYVSPIPALQGTVDDAKDIAQALNKAKAEKVIVLTDAAATKQGIDEAWHTLVAEAKAGDTIVFSYAGHGSQEPARLNDPNEPDGRDENLPLVGYALSGSGLADRLTDNELSDWISEAKAKNIEVTLVVDSSHVGTICDAACDYSNVILLAGAADDRVSPEVSIDGKARGALSYAFARALEGNADADKDGVITRKELLQFVRAAVLQRTDSQQVIVTKPDRAEDVAFLRLK